MISQSRTSTTVLASLVIASVVVLGVVGCSSHPTTPTGSNTISTTENRPLVDVSAVWQTEPLPDCPTPPIVFNGSVPPGLSLPDKSSVARELQGVKSPASEGWVRTKLGWVTQWLSKTRADIAYVNAPGDNSTRDTFGEYVKHIRDELREGRDTPSDLDSRFPEGCQ
ncbi:Uncharacterised protein [Mycobacteroides abscessus]|nr:Uncharacterised protein [Mycobacteroides abscessus]